MPLKKQLSVFVENKVGSIYELCTALSKASINILGVLVSDDLDWGVIRLVERPAGLLRGPYHAPPIGGPAWHGARRLWQSVRPGPGGVLRLCALRASSRRRGQANLVGSGVAAENVSPCAATPRPDAGGLGGRCLAGSRGGG